MIIPLSALDLVIATALVLVAGGISVGLRLGLESKLAIASVRTIVQLILVGYVLEWVFGLASAPVVCGMMGLMIAAAGRAAVGRSSRRYRGVHWRAFATLTLTGVLTTLTVTSAIVGVDPWYRPQYVIPLLGMVLGNGLTGISLCLDQLLATLDRDRGRIEAELALGATAWEAARAPVAGAVRRGMIPIINSMMVVGIVSLPGMMTGQILAGSDPIDAVKYQIVVMFMLAAGTSVGCILIGLSTYRVMFNEKHQLRVEKITRVERG